MQIVKYQVIFIKRYEELLKQQYKDLTSQKEMIASIVKKLNDEDTKEEPVPEVEQEEEPLPENVHFFPKRKKYRLKDLSDIPTPDNLIQFPQSE